MAESDFEQFEFSGPVAVAELVPVLFADTRDEAEQCRALLEQCGVPAVIESDGLGSTDVVFSSGSAGVLVPAELFDQATEVLASLDEEEDEFEEEDDLLEDEFDDEEDDDLDDDYDEDYDDEDDLDEYDDDDPDVFYDDDEDDEDYDDEDS